MSFSPTAVARATAITTAFKNLSGGRLSLLPQRVGVIAQGATGLGDATPFDFTSAKQVGDNYGFGTPAHLMALMLRPQNAEGIGDIPSTIYPVIDADVGSGSATAATDATITITGAQVGAAEYMILANGIPSGSVVLADAATSAQAVTAIVTAINGAINMPVTAADGIGDVVDLTPKWVGASTNEIFIEVVGQTGTGLTFVVVQPSDGAGSAVVTNALAGFGNAVQVLPM